MWLLTALTACIVEPPPTPAPLVVTPVPKVAVAPLDTQITPPPPARSDHPACQAYRAAARDVDDGSWTGSAESCDPGQATSAYASSGLPMLDYVRSLAGLRGVAADVGDRAQACALVMHVNDAITHFPPADWECVSEAAADSAAVALLANVPADDSILAYMVDPGNADTLGHRRWLLSNWLDGLEIGSTDGYSCLELTGVNMGAEGNSWTAWPPPGDIPREVLESYGYSTHAVGWSLQSDVMDLTEAVVTIHAAGESVRVSATPLEEGLGSRWAVAFPVSGLPTSTSYRVEVGNVAEPFTYTVDVLECGPE